MAGEPVVDWLAEEEDLDLQFKGSEKSSKLLLGTPRGQHSLRT